MKISDSCEVRWFQSQGTPGPEWNALFAGVVAEPERTDQYFATQHSGVGFKLRRQQGQPTKLETKYLLGSLGPVELSPGVVGRVERWNKISLEGQDVELDHEKDWLEVRKVRRLLKFAWENGDVRRFDPTKEHPDAGASFELTALSGAPGVTGFTVGAEAFGPAKQLLTILIGVVKHVLVAQPSLKLDVAQSCSYPAWQERLLLLSDGN